MRVCIFLAISSASSRFEFPLNSSGGWITEALRSNGRPQSLERGAGARCPARFARSSSGSSPRAPQRPQRVGTIRTLAVLWGFHARSFELVSSVRAGRRPAGGDRRAGRGRPARRPRADAARASPAAARRWRWRGSSSWSRSRPSSCATTRRWPPSCAPSSAISSRTTRSSISSRTSTTTSPKRTSPTPTPTSRRTPRSTTRSSGCGIPRPSRC